MKIKASDITKLKGGNYVTLAAYAKSEGISRVAALKRIKTGNLKSAVKIGTYYVVKV